MKFWPIWKQRSGVLARPTWAERLHSDDLCADNPEARWRPFPLGCFYCCSRRSLRRCSPIRGREGCSPQKLRDGRQIIWFQFIRREHSVGVFQSGCKADTRGHHCKQCESVVSANDLTIKPLQSPSGAHASARRRCLSRLIEAIMSPYIALGASCHVSLLGAVIVPKIIWVCNLGPERMRPKIIGLTGMPWQVALQQSLTPFAGRERFSKTKPCRTVIFQRTATTPSLCQPKGAVQPIRPRLCTSLLHRFVHLGGPGERGGRNARNGEWWVLSLGRSVISSKTCKIGVYSSRDSLRHSPRSRWAPSF
jgi:hypothetical protein